MKRFLSLLLTAVMLLGCIPAGAADSDYDYKGNGYYAINKYKGTDTELVIPAAVGGSPVHVLNQNAISRQPFTSVVLPDCLRILDGFNFYSNLMLTSVTLNEGLVQIGESNFIDCDALEALTIPASVRYIGANCIKYNDVLTTVRFLGECPTFEASCFMGAHSDMVVYVPDDQLDAYKAALPASLNIQPSGQNAVIVAPESDESLYTFDADTATITGYAGNASYISIPAQIGGVPVKKVVSAFQDNRILSHVIVPEGVEVLGKEAFDHAIYLVDVQLPSTLRRIEDFCFWVCALPAIELNEGLEFIGEKAFMDADMSTLVIPDSVKTIAKEAFSRCYISNLTLGAGVESIGEKAFYDNSLKTMHFRMETVPTAEAQALTGKNKEPSLTLADGITEETFNAYVALMAEQFPACTVQQPELKSSFPALDAAAAEPFIGSWHGVAAMEGEDILSMSTLGMTMDVVLNADASGTFGMDGEALSGAWYVENGAAMFAPVLEEGGEPVLEEALPLTLDENGRIVIDFGGIFLLLEQEGKVYAVPAVPERPWPELDQEAAGEYIGTWDAVNYFTDGELYDAALIGPMTLTLNSDGTATLIQDGVDSGFALRWYTDHAIAFVGPTMSARSKLVINGRGDLEMTQEDTVVTMALRKEEAAPAAGNAIGADGAAFIGEWTLESAAGLSAAMLGMEMVLTLNEDGTCSMDDGFEIMYDVWSMENGMALVQGAYLTVNADGKLVMSQDGMDMIFSRDGAAGEALSEEEQMLALLELLAQMEKDENSGAAAPANDTILGNWDDGAKLLDVYEDGRIELTYKSDGYVSKMTWEMVDGVPTITKGIWKNIPLKVENGLLIITKDTLYQEFTRVGEAPDVIIGGQAAPEAAPAGPAHIPGTADDFIGGWICADDEHIQLLLLENEANLIEGADCFTTTWTVENGVAAFNGMQLYLQEDWSGILDNSGELVKFNRGYVEKPQGAAPAAPAAGNAIGADGAAFIGEWTLESAAGLSAAMLGMEMVLTLNEDGTCSMDDGFEIMYDVWSMENGMALVQGAYLTVNADGKLVMSQDGMDMIFSRDGAAGEALSEEEQMLALLELLAQMEGMEAGSEDAGLPEHLKPYVGTWHMVYLATGGLEGDLRTMGITGKLELNADGTGKLSGAASDSGTWYDDEGTVRFGQAEAPLTLLDGGFLRYGNQLSGYMVFSQDESAVWSPAPAAGAVPAAAPQVPQQPAGQAPQGGGFLDRTFTLDSAVTVYAGNAFPVDVAAYGEYTVRFGSDGSVKFVQTGMELPAAYLTWAQNDQGDFVITYAVGGATVMEYVFKPAGSNLEMDYYGVIMTFVPAE